MTTYECVAGQTDSPDIPQSVHRKIGAIVVTENTPTRDEILKDSKTSDLSPVDALLLKAESVEAGSARFDLLVNRVTGSVEYVLSPAYGRYLRPKFILPSAQSLYDNR